MAALGRLTKYSAIILALVLFSCKDTKKGKKESLTTVESKSIERPNFNADSAYTFIAEQVAFGPRVPNTEAHKKTAKYLSSKLQSYGFQVTNQKAQVTAFDGKRLNINNIIGEYLPNNNDRILLFAHWDTRPFADQDTENKTEPIDGANDGGSGVAILLEIARQLQIYKPTIGVDIIFFDAEDYGRPSGSIYPQKSTSSWCLGSQYWSKNMHKPNYRANYGILLDMVGGKNAVFPKEAISMHFAPYVVNKVWNIAHQLGHGNYFIDQQVQFVGEDDHLYVNKNANIPSIDIIEYNSETGAFNKTWHTHDDNLENIDKESLQAVGETVLATVLNE